MWNSFRHGRWLETRIDLMIGNNKKTYLSFNYMKNFKQVFLKRFMKLKPKFTKESLAKQCETKTYPNFSASL